MPVALSCIGIFPCFGIGDTKLYKIIVVSLPHRSDDAIRQNADLSGRLSLINIDTWKKEELKQIALKGFNELQIHISDETAGKIASESLTSPQLMQYICLSICTLLDSDVKPISEINDSILETAYRFTTMNFEYNDVVHVMTKGPNPRGRLRKLFRTVNGKELDLYGLIVESLAKGQPIVAFTFDDLKSRIDTLIPEGDRKPDKQALKASLNKLQEQLTAKQIFITYWNGKIIWCIALIPCSYFTCTGGITTEHFI